MHLRGLQLLLLCGGGRLERRLALGQPCVQLPQLRHLPLVVLHSRAAVCTVPMLAPHHNTKIGDSRQGAPYLRKETCTVHCNGCPAIRCCLGSGLLERTRRTSRRRVRASMSACAAASSAARCSAVASRALTVCEASSTYGVDEHCSVPF